MAKLTDQEIRIFPLKDIDSVVKLFKIHLERNSEPNLAVLSIIIGCIENTLTCFNRAPELNTPGEVEDEEPCQDYCDPFKTPIPVVEYEDVEALYQRFLSIIKAHVDVGAYGHPKFATRELVKRVSDVVWCTLSSSYYKDRAHLQSIYSYMSGAKLDSSGTTLAVVASLQTLGYHDVHLALSEDHTWIVCGEHGEISVEVTWHGKGNEDKRGLPVTDEIFSKSWLYVNGRPVICTRHMEVATIISNMNPGINATTDSEEVILLQQALLWLLYDFGHLAKYPMAIDNLGDLEEMSATKGRPPATKLYEEAILSNVRYYANQHVYPYTYLGGYLYRNKMFKMALRYWGKAAHVIRHYNYSRDDEEIYKEFLEIATELIPYIIRTTTASSSSLFSDPFNFAFILEFYDGICGWEEESPTPVLHIGWAKALLTSISKFDISVRSRVTIVCIDPESNEEKESIDSSKEELNMFGCMATDESSVTGDSTHDQNGNTSALYSREESGRLFMRQPSICLYSAKMRGLKDLLLADKLNSQAISLQLTAQSQVTLSKKRDRSGVQTSENVEHSSGRPKRTRREQYSN